MGVMGNAWDTLVSTSSPRHSTGSSSHTSNGPTHDESRRKGALGHERSPTSDDGGADGEDPADDAEPDGGLGAPTLRRRSGGRGRWRGEVCKRDVGRDKGACCKVGGRADGDKHGDSAAVRIGLGRERCDEDREHGL